MLPSDPPALVALLLAVDPQGLGGAVVAGPGGPAPEGWSRYLRQSLPETTPWRRIPLGVTPDRMTGGIDLTVTLREGRRVLLPGIPAEANGGLLLLPSAERLRPEVATVLLEVLDRGRLRVEREGISGDLPARVAVVALDEAHGDEPGVPEALRDRLAFLVALPPRWVPPGPAEPAVVEGARRRLGRVTVPDDALEALAAMTLAPTGAGGTPNPSLRPALLALRTARALAALRESARVEPMDTWLAAALVLAPRGIPIPRPPASAEGPETPEDEDAAPGEEVPPAADDAAGAEGRSPEPPPARGPDDDAGPADADEGDAADPDIPPDPAEGVPERPAQGTMEAPAEGRGDRQGGLPDRLVAAIAALLPTFEEEGARSRGRSLRGAGGGRAGAPVEAHERGRRIGAAPGAPGRGRRLDLPATLRAAAPWQPVRGREGGAPLAVEAGDLHVQRRVRPAARRTLFVVDASGSQALRRLGEVKGAVELLLADSYRAREEVALIVFRDREARLLLPPTRSLTRAKRLLRGLPGGGGTPLALGLAQALGEAEAALRQGVTPRILLLTDGRPNVDAGGRGGRTAAREDALAVARRLRSVGGGGGAGASASTGGGPTAGIEIRVLDTGIRPEPFLEELARAMGARLHHLPFADARRIRRALDAPSNPKDRRA